MAEITHLVAEPDKPTIVITRLFAAPPAIVFEACTRPELVSRWFGPRGFTAVVCEIDLRVGGRYRYVVRGPDGRDMGFSGEFREIVPAKRIVQTFVFDPYPQAEAIETAVFTEQAGKTLLTVTILHKSIEFRDGHVQSGMEAGMNESHQRLDDVIASLSARS